ncbi:MAG TPA: MFS transporter [Methylotenera sp.]|nr:MFS transporter [Methylotenera sp.]HPH04821.1 MFS transporter [Methylotenera sp.]HPN01729.1 MFS transporter [Methylotenera sp.]
MQDYTPPETSAKHRNISIIALNIVSALAQFGQYGLGVTLIPIALKARNASVENIGFTSAAFWVGMLVGLLLAGQLTRQFGYRLTLIFGISLSALSFAFMPLIHWPLWFIPAALIGFGLGLRWIALETWLYNLVPTNARGRVVGIHESLLAFAAILGPLLIVSIDTVKPDAFWVASTVIMLALAIIPFAMPVAINNQAQTVTQTFSLSNSLKFWLGFGAIVAGLGGYAEGSLLAFIPVYIADIGYTPANAAFLLTLFQTGAMCFQFPVGWMADHHGLFKTTKMCVAIAIMTLVFALIFGQQLTMFSIAAFVLGGAVASTLSLGLIWAIHNNTGDEITYKVRQVSIVYTSLSAVGPLVTGLIISHTSSASLFWQQLAIMLLLMLMIHHENIKKS